MDILATCPWCAHKWLLKKAAADRRVACLKCGRLFKVPDLDELPRAKRVIDKAKGRVSVDEQGKTYG